MTTNSIHKKVFKKFFGKTSQEIKVFTKVSTKSVHKTYPQKNLTKNDHTIFPDSVYEKCPRPFKKWNLGF